MTTAARPTWAPAKGGQEQGGARMFGPSQKFSARDIASHTVLKTRKEGQGTEEEIRKRRLREELEDREREHYHSKDTEKAVAAGESTKLLGYADESEASPQKKLKRNDDDASSESDASGSESESDEDDDDTARLQAELEQIRRERAAEKAFREKQKQGEEAKELLRGNPLMNFNGGTDVGVFKVQKRWDDDVVFKNQARGEAKQEKRFINDTIRNDFHRKFLNKYMK